jgi:hypothetical protein
MVMARRSKTNARSNPQAMADDLPISERIMLFCLSSGTDWEHAGIANTTVQQMLVRRLIDHVGPAGRLKLTPLGRSVFAALLKPEVGEQDE